MDGVLYIVGGVVHAIMALVSIESLRRHWDGVIAVAVWNDEAHDIISVRSDVTLTRIRSVTDGLTLRRYTADRLRMHELSPFSRTVSFDADTYITGSIDRLWPQHDSNEVVLTSVLAGPPPMPKDIYREQMQCRAEQKYGRRDCYPHVNTGVIGFSTLSVDFFRRWKYQMRKIPFFSIDQLCQIFYWQYPHIMLDDRYNRIPYMSDCAVTDTEVTEHDICIWHLAGKRRFRGELAYRVWWPDCHRILKRHKLMQRYRSVLPLQFRYHERKSRYAKV